MEGTNEQQKKKVVVVGGGIAGGLLAKNLQSFADVVLIDPYVFPVISPVRSVSGEFVRLEGMFDVCYRKEYFEIPWAKLRSMVQPSVAQSSIFDHKNYFKKGTIITSSAVNITETDVLTAGGHSIAYDYLVIATGITQTFPATKAERLRQFDEVLVIGGGPTGVELAGEIVTDFPGKKVTLVHRGPRLLQFLGLKASTKALEWFTTKKVDVLLDQTVNLSSTSNTVGTYETSKGETIAADCYFLCTGASLPGSLWLKETILKGSLDPRGRLVVDENLRVKGYQNIFAIGDITNVPEFKQGFYAQKHAAVTTKNIKLLIEGCTESKLAMYKPGPLIALISLGRKEAVLRLPFLTVSGCIPGKIKSKALFRLVVIYVVWGDVSQMVISVAEVTLKPIFCVAMLQSTTLI
ncbi:hypothetical protein ACLOJK_020822 [Asimina triloba]